MVTGSEKQVGNEAEEDSGFMSLGSFVPTGRGKGMGPSSLIEKASSCHLACGTGTIIYLICSCLGRNCDNNATSIAGCIACLPLKPPQHRGQQGGRALGWQGRQSSRRALGLQPGREGLSLSQKSPSKGFPAPPSRVCVWQSLQDFCCLHLFLFL